MSVRLLACQQDAGKAYGLLTRCRLDFDLYMPTSCQLDFRHADKVFTS